MHIFSMYIHSILAECLCVYIHVHAGHPSMLSVNASSLGGGSSSPGQASLAGQVVVDEQGKKREIRLMKNRYMYMHVNTR